MAHCRVAATDWSIPPMGSYPSHMALATTSIAPRQGVHASSFRPDVEGMRALAIVLVVVFHAGFTPLSGGFIGVDVFFVISGFLITRLLLAEVRRGGRIRLAEFWARRARRLLPASALVLAVVTAVTLLTVDPLGRVETGRDVTASAAFVANWWFSHLSMDYFAADRSLSPVLHFWSLSVEEQYYLLWPPALALLFAVAWRVGLSRQAALRSAAVLLGVVAVGSFGWALLETARTPVQAYYGTPARAWELAVGGLVAMISTTRFHLPGRVAAVTGWLGLGAIVVAAFVITDQTPFPGVAALAPVLGTAAVLVAGATAGLPGPLGMLGSRIPREIGKLSYSWYLWHWPFLIFAPLIFGELDAVGTWVVVTASLAAAWLTFRFVENPVRRSPRLAASAPLSLMLGAALILVGLAAGLAAARAPWVPGGPSAQSGASEAEPGTPEASDAITPDPLVAREDTNRIRSDECQSLFDWTEVKECVYGDVGSDRRWVLWGDSHAVQWFPALEANAIEAGAALQVFGKTSCPASQVTLFSRKWDRTYTECTQWRDEVYRQVRAMPKGTVVFLSGMNEYAVEVDGRSLSEERSADPIAAGHRDIAATLVELGMTVVSIRDTPFPDRDVPACVAGNRTDPSVCDFPRTAADRGRSWEERTLGDVPGVLFVDLIDEVCTPVSCPAVVDGILRWRDQDHLTATYVATLDEALATQLRDLGIR